MNHAQLLAAGVLDFNIASNSFVPLNFVQQNIPMVAVAAIFQKDPSVLIAHPGQGNDSLAALKGKPIMIGSDTRVGSWLFLKQKFGYTDDQIRPYTFSVAPFLADPKAIQQGYLTSEPFTIEKAGREAGRHAARRCRLYQLRLADPDLAKAGAAKSPISCSALSMPASRAGTAISTAIPAPAQRADQARQSGDDRRAARLWHRDKIKEYGIVDSGDAKTDGIGAMTDARWRDFFDTMVKAGVYPGRPRFPQAPSRCNSSTRRSVIGEKKADAPR